MDNLSHCYRSPVFPLVFAINEQMTTAIQKLPIHVSRAKHYYAKVKGIKISGRSSMFSDAQK
jgi:hypothetical protein